jgi:diguanylate cyclase (GGDEF)-like protein
MEEKEYRALEYIKELLQDPLAGEPEGDLAEIPALREIRAFIRELRNTVASRESALEFLQENEIRLRHLASHDALTGALNRRSFILRSAVEAQLACQRNLPCCIAMMDIDFFKRFNDTYGHLNGDEALRHVVKVASGILRKVDFLGRYGGEEFVFFLGSADLETGGLIAERIRAAIEAHPVQCDAASVPIAVSFGVASAFEGDVPVHLRPFALETSFLFENSDSNALPENQEDIKFIRELLNKADKALYAAKRTGRNKVVRYHDELTPSV